MIIPLNDGKSFILSSYSDDGKKDPDTGELALYITEVEKQIKNLSKDNLEVSTRYLLLSSTTTRMGFSILGKHYLEKAIASSPNISKREKLSILEFLESDEIYLHVDTIMGAFPGAIESWGMIE